MTDILRHTGKRRAIRIRRDFDRARRLLRTVATDPNAARAKVINKVAKYATSRVVAPVQTNGRPRLPALSIPSGPVARPDLAVAVILDAFFRTGVPLRVEPDNLITPDDWRQRLAAQPPALLFVESAWNGNRRSRVAAGHVDPSRSKSVLAGEKTGGLVPRGGAIPTVFWNKGE